MDGDISPLHSLVDRLKTESMPTSVAAGEASGSRRGDADKKPRIGSASNARRISDRDLDRIAESVEEIVKSVCSTYYIDDVAVSVSQRKGHIVIDCEMSDTGA